MRCPNSFHDPLRNRLLQVSLKRPSGGGREEILENLQVRFRLLQRQARRSMRVSPAVIRLVKRKRGSKLMRHPFHQTCAFAGGIAGTTPEP